jgi:hypothetical protein
MSYRGTVRNGVVVLEPEAKLPEGTVVRVEAAEPPAAGGKSKVREADELDPVWRMGELAVPTGITDLATNADHYLYGHPKVTDVP